MNVDNIAVGANAAAHAEEVNALAGDHPIRVCVMPNARVVLGAGNVGLLEVVDGADLQQAMFAAQNKRDDLKTQAVAMPKTLFTFIRT